ncbi:uncharacterized protein LOC129919384 [Episyrphus balteatus]|uniref:uncharacterized protein LOC129919384 n=1 Tax=Episyrphus balteatus TaxID=286459 RepID=UPI0024864049|nr:uncharacterized protein LOC129919384 [Episyrphus balteatus]
MGKLFQTILVIGIVAIALCNATPAKLDKIRSTRNRFLARQEVAEDIPAQTPYPPAGFRPEVAFDLPTEEKPLPPTEGKLIAPTEEKLVAPANHYLPPLTDPAMFYSAPAEVYGPPAETYGPPEISDKDGKNVPENSEENKEKVTEEATIEETVTEEVVTDEEEQQKPIIDEDETEVEQDNFIPERLVLAKSTNSIKAAKLKQFAPLTRKNIPAQQFYLINGSLYTLA